jgi:osmoprotectant transport system permease protein
VKRLPLLLAAALAACSRPPAEITICSKKFTESVLLGELATQVVRTTGAPARQRDQLGGTQILWNALASGACDAYPDYTGTLAEDVLQGRGPHDEEGLRRALAERGVVMSRSLGFNNTYAIGMKEETAARLGLGAISDLARHPELRLGFSEEFMNRADGWPALRDRYHLPQSDVRGLDHDLAYRGLDGGTLDAIDLYSTDAEIRYYHLRALADDLHHFPDYTAVLLTRADLATRAPAAAEALRRLDGAISPREMIAMNARAKLDKSPEPEVAAAFLESKLGLHTAARGETLPHRLLRTTLEHLLLVSLSLFAAILLAIPLGILAARRPRVGQAILAATGVLQTIPSLPLLVFMIPLLGIGTPPALLALFLYSLLPIVRNTCTGIPSIPAPLRESAEALGLPPRAILRRVELPLASPAILAGIKTSAVINVGTATLGAVIGAGGYGQPILTGIRLDDWPLILQGAIPAALLALLVQGLFEGIERVLVPKGLRLPSGGA